MIRGTTLNQPIKINNYDEPKAGDIFRFGVKKNSGDPNYAILKQQKNENASKIEFFNLKLTPSDTLKLQPGQYTYEFALQSGDDYYVLIPATPFIIKPNITQYGDGQGA